MTCSSVEQPSLVRAAERAVTAEAAGGDDAVARNEDGEAVLRAERAGGAGGAGTAGERGELAVGDDLAARNGAKAQARARWPNGVSSLEVELDVGEVVSAPGEVPRAAARSELARNCHRRRALSRSTRRRSGRRVLPSQGGGVGARPRQLVPHHPAVVCAELCDSPALGLVAHARHRHDDSPYNRALGHSRHRPTARAVQRADQELCAREAPSARSSRARLDELAGQSSSSRSSSAARTSQLAETFDQVMPHDKDHVLAKVSKGDASHVQQAIDAAATAWHDWSRTPWEERAAVHPARGRAARRPVARDAQRRDDARPVEDRAPGGDRRRLRADRLLALQRRAT